MTQNPSSQWPQPTGPQSNFGQPGVPQPGFSQPGVPQPGFGQPGVPQPGFSPQPGFGSGGFGGPGGPVGPQKSSGGNNKTLVMVIVGLVIVALIGAVFFWMSQNREKDPQPQPQPSPTEPTNPRTPSTSPSTDTSESPSESPSSPPSGGETVQVADGYTVALPAGWKLYDRKGNLVILESQNDDIIALEVFSANANPSADIVRRYISRQAQKLTSPQIEPQKAHSIHSSLDVSSGAVSGVRSSSNGSFTMRVYTVISVRKSDQVSVMVTAFYDKSQSGGNLANDYNDLLKQMLQAQVK